MILKKTFFKLMNNAVFGKTMENVKRHRDIKFVTIERERNYLLSEPNYYKTKFFAEHLLTAEMKKNRDTSEKACLFRTLNTSIK